MPEASDVQRLFALGHSTRSFDEFLALLRAHGIVQLADIRAFPASRRHPHFGRAALESALPAAGVAYRWLPALGGRRKAVRGSTANAAWRVEGFRAYADHMATAEFASGLGELRSWALAAPTACMCAEAFHLRCHRQLLADALVALGWEVLHIESATRARPHELTSFACVGADRRVSYPGAKQLFDDLESA